MVKQTDLQRSPSCEVDISPWLPKTELLRRANFNLEAGFPLSRSFLVSTDLGFKWFTGVKWQKRATFPQTAHTLGRFHSTLSKIIRFKDSRF